MTIALADMKLRKSQRLTDFDDGGGLMIGDEVIDGLVNEVFDDVSRTDRSNGDCSLRKIYPHVSSPNTDRLLDGLLIVTQAPADPNVSICAVRFGGFATERAAVQSHLESTALELHNTDTSIVVQTAQAPHTEFETTNEAFYSVGQRIGVVHLSPSIEYPRTVASKTDLGGGTWRIGFTPAINEKQGPGFGEVRTYGASLTDTVATLNGFAAGHLAGDDVIGLVSVFAPVGPDVLTSDPEIIGIDPSKLPPEGKFIGHKSGGVVVLMNTQPDTMPAPLSASQIVQLSRTDLASLRVEDAAGLDVPSAGYWTIDLALGQITFDAALDLTGYAEPLVVYHRIENQRTVIDVNPVTHQITINRGLSRDFGADSLAASALYLGNMQARYKDLRDHKVWSAYGVGGEYAVASYDDAGYPVELSNLGTQSHRWAIVFTSATTYEVRNEDRGTLATGTTGADLTVTNNQTGEDYFTLRAAGWGTGWINGNGLAFETVAAAEPVWLCRVVQDEDAAVSDDLGRIEFRGDAE